MISCYARVPSAGPELSISHIWVAPATSPKAETAFLPYSLYRYQGQDIPPGTRRLDFQLERDVADCWEAAIERNQAAGLGTELKTLVYQVGPEYWCFNLPGDRRLPLRRWDIPGLRMVRFSESHDLKAGCINPFRVANRLPRLRMFFDLSLRKHLEYYTNDGTRRGTLAIPIAALADAFPEARTFASVE